MASSSSFLLAAVALAVLFAGSCAKEELTFKAGPDCSDKHIVITPNLPIKELEIKEKGADDFTSMTEGKDKSWIFDSTKPLKGPMGVRFAGNFGGYRVADNFLPTKDIKPGTVYKTGVSI
jgi:hypothetical protein